MALRKRLRLLWLALTMKPISGGAEGDGGEGEGEPEGKPEGKPGKPEGKPEGKPDEGEPVKPEDDWQAKARKWERDAKKDRKAREEAERKLKEAEDTDKSEHEKAVEAARKEGETKAQQAAEKERRSDRLEVAVTRQAAKGVKVGDGEDAKPLRFADAEDALLRVQRGISRGDIDADEIYDSEGKVNTDALSTALGEILESNPHLVGGEGERQKPSGDSDARKGDAAQKDLEAMSPADHAKRKYGTKT